MDSEHHIVRSRLNAGENAMSWQAGTRAADAGMATANAAHAAATAIARDLMLEDLSPDTVRLDVFAVPTACPCRRTAPGDHRPIMSIGR
jgi:hypothetical protein